MLNMVTAPGGDSFLDIGDLARQERHGASNSFRHRKLPSLAVVIHRPQKGGSASTRPCCSAMATIISASARSSSVWISRRSTASHAFLSSARYPDSQPRLLSVGDCDHLAVRSPETAQRDPAEVANRGASRILNDFFARFTLHLQCERRRDQRINAASECLP